jgi:predicted nucleotidyltransferase
MLLSRTSPTMRPSEILAAKADEIREIIARYPVRNPRIFGSAARGDDAEGSDLDLLVDPLEGTTYFDLAGLELELGELLGIKIDIATPGALRRELAERIGPELKPL